MILDALTVCSMPELISARPVTNLTVNVIKDSTKNDSSETEDDQEQDTETESTGGRFGQGNPMTR